MNLRNLFFIAALAFCLSLAHAALVPEVAKQLDHHNVIWTTPSNDAKGSMILGNGDIGLNAWVEPGGDLVFFIGKTDAWDSNMQLLKLGKVRVKFTPALQTGSGFRQTLILRDGAMVVETPGATVKLWVDANHPVIQVDATAKDGKKLEASASFEIWRKVKKPLGPPSLNGTAAYNGTGFTTIPAYSWPDNVIKSEGDRIGWYHRNEVTPWPASMKLQKVEDLLNTQQDPFLHRTMGALLQGENMKPVSDTELRSLKAANSICLQIIPLTEITKTAKAWQDKVETLGDRIAETDTATRWAKHQTWWQDFWSRSWIFIQEESENGGNEPINGKPIADKTQVGQQSDADRISQTYNLQRYVNACGGRGAFPIKFNGSIFTIDNSPHGPDYRRWGGGYWWQNTRLPYWAMIEAGDYDLMKPLFKMYMDALPARKLATMNYYGHEGAFFPETMTFYGNYLDQGVLGYGTEEQRQGRPDGETVNEHIRLYWQGAVELTAMMIRYYQHTGDEAFLKDTLLPFAHEIFTFYDQHYKRGADGKILFDPAYSLEDIWYCSNPMPDIVGLRVNLSALIPLVGDESKRKQYQRMLSEMPELPTTTDKNGKKRFAPCSPLKWKKRKNNSEKPELYGVFPYLLHGVGRPQLDMAIEAWKHTKKEYGPKVEGWSQNPIFLACLGMTKEAKAKQIRRTKMLAKGVRFPVFWFENMDWSPDQDHGSVNMIGLQKMIMQPNLSILGDEIFLLPAWPREWDAHFKLHAPKDTTVEGKVVNGKLTELKVTPESRRKDIRIRQGDEFVAAE